MSLFIKDLQTEKQTPYEKQGELKVGTNRGRTNLFLHPYPTLNKVAIACLSDRRCHRTVAQIIAGGTPAVLLLRTRKPPSCSLEVFINTNVGSDLLSRLRTTIGPNALASEFGMGSGVSRWV